MKKVTYLRYGIVLLITAFILIGLYLLNSLRLGYSGFPLDDAWIHQVYARNLVHTGEWAYNPGEPSSGSTSPLWSGLLSVGYLLSLPSLVWVAFVGVLTLSGFGLLAEAVLRSKIPEFRPRIPWFGLFFVFEWHLVWASVSGMETSLFSLAVIALFFVIWQKKKQYWLAGLVIGVSTWIRPDGITLLGPALFVLLFDSIDKKNKIFQTGKITVTFLAFFLPYLAFNLKFAGAIWPSTFLAKQMEYQAAQSIGLVSRLSMMVLPILAGGGVILLPGIVWAVLEAARKRDFAVLSAIFWSLGFIFLYALRLPVNYQHGRYMMPVIGVFYLIGFWGLMQIRSSLLRTPWARILNQVWVLSLAAVSAIFLFLGMDAYQKDVAIIETEMVRTARWVETNTPSGSLIAAHDIGALGYFSHRKIIDLAGLINPQVIPIIRNEAALSNYLDDQHVEYLVTFPGWYPQLVESKKRIYTTNDIVSPSQGGENMSVYLWQ